MTTKIDLKHLLGTVVEAEPLRDLVGALQFDPSMNKESIQVLAELDEEIADAAIKSDENLYRELDLLADALTLAVPGYEIVLEHNPSTRQDYILVEKKA